MEITPFTGQDLLKLYAQFPLLHIATAEPHKNYIKTYFFYSKKY